jgi:hypothetical protein
MAFHVEVNQAIKAWAFLFILRIFFAYLVSSSPVGEGQE